MDKIRVGVIFGGRSGEHEVSLVSAASVLAALDVRKYEIQSIAIEKSGRWRTGPDALDYLTYGGIPPAACLLPPDPETGGLLIDEGNGTYARMPRDVVFPVLHGPDGEDGTLQGLLELADIAYVGAGVLGSSVGMDKIVQKRLHRAAGLPVVDSVSFRASDFESQRAELISRIERELGYPVFVKPPNLGSSVGITKAGDREALLRSIAHASSYDRMVLVEKAVPRAREIEVAVLGNSECTASIPGEIIPSNEFYDYNAKYVDGASRCIIPAELPTELAERIRSLAVEAFHAVFCEGMARVDFLLCPEDEALYLNEINTIPGFTSISMYPKLFEATGVPYPDLLDRLIELAIQRRQERNSLKRSFEPASRWHQRG